MFHKRFLRRYIMNSVSKSQTRAKIDIQIEHGYHAKPHQSVGGSGTRRDLKTEQQWQRGCEDKLCHSSNAVTCHLNGKMARIPDQLLAVALFRKILFYVTLALTPRSPHTPFEDAISLSPFFRYEAEYQNNLTSYPATLPHKTPPSFATI